MKNILIDNNIGFIEYLADKDVALKIAEEIFALVDDNKDKEFVY